MGGSNSKQLEEKLDQVTEEQKKMTKTMMDFVNAMTSNISRTIRTEVDKQLSERLNKMCLEGPYPDVWPPINQPDLSQLKVLTVLDTEESDRNLLVQKYKNSLTPLGQSQIYMMKSKKRAFVSVINNERFEKLPHREGTERDANGLKTLFQQLGCTVEIKKDLTRIEALNYLQGLSMRNFQEFDCFMLFILSHGREDIVFGTDGYTDTETHHNYLKLENIVHLFAKRSKLQGKPKLFFIQACQGNTRDPGVGVVVPDGDPLNGGVQSNLRFVEDEETDAQGENWPSYSDVTVALSTTRGNVSWRHQRYGSWFIQAIIEVFAEYAYKLDIHGLLTRVNGLLARAATKDRAYKQVMEKRDTLTKHLFLFPGLHPETSS